MQHLNIILVLCIEVEISRRTITSVSSVDRGIHNLNRLPKPFVLHAGVIIVFLHMVGSGTAFGALNRIPPCLFEYLLTVLPIQLEVFSNDKLFGLIEMRKFVVFVLATHTVAAIGLSNGIVEIRCAFRQRSVQLAVNHQQTVSTRFGAEILPQLIDEMQEILSFGTAARINSSGTRFVINVEAMVTIGDILLCQTVGIETQRLFPIFGPRAFKLLLVAESFADPTQQQTGADARSFNLLNKVQIGLTRLGIGITAPQRDDIDRIGKRPHKVFHRGSLPRPASEPAERHRMLTGLISTQICVIIGTFDIRLLDRQCFRFIVLLARNEAATGEKHTHKSYKYVFHNLF